MIILGSEMIDNLNIKTKMLNFEVCVLINRSLTVFASKLIKTRSSKSNIFVFMLRLPIISDPSIGVGTANFWNTVKVRVRVRSKIRIRVWCHECCHER